MRQRTVASGVDAVRIAAALRCPHYGGSRPFAAPFRTSVRRCSTGPPTGASAQKRCASVARASAPTTFSSPGVPAWRELARETARDPMLWFLVGDRRALRAARPARRVADAASRRSLPLVAMDAVLHRRTQASTRACAAVSPRPALVVRDGATLEIPVEELVPGDLARGARGQPVPGRRRRDRGRRAAGRRVRADRRGLPGAQAAVRRAAALDSGDGRASRSTPSTGAMRERACSRAPRRCAFCSPAATRSTARSCAPRAGHPRADAAPTRGRQSRARAAARGRGRALRDPRRGAVAPGIRLGRRAGERRDARRRRAARGVPGRASSCSSASASTGSRGARRWYAVRCRSRTSDGSRCICSDKTGTITLGELEPHAPAARARIDGSAPLPSSPRSHRARRAATRSTRRSCAPARSEAFACVLPSVVATFPFTEDRRRETAVVRAEGRGLLAATKGAPELVLSLCASTCRERTPGRSARTTLAAEGHKVIACASRELAERVLARRRARSRPALRGSARVRGPGARGRCRTRSRSAARPASAS